MVGLRGTVLLIFTPVPRPSLCLSKHVHGCTADWIGLQLDPATRKSVEFNPGLLYRPAARCPGAQEGPGEGQGRVTAGGVNACVQ